ncbi:insulinase family protein [Anaerotignum sp.]|uniref:insulinase family protein n=1 Tax=Anaerotignum sp. TaxID=2039241 RepID=UPI003734EE4A
MKLLEINQIYHGFQLKKIQKLGDISATGYLFTHLKSGAQLCYLDTEDHNKVFSVSFKTPPDNDCGTPHILEHSVLCGSRKYQAKDPFNELAKGSLNTFLNAMTYADKTMYPIASCNEKDFRNMMDVYLNAVFYPNIYTKKGIFLQEGWRYADAGNTPEITGVVYNEMKGALSDPESRLAGVIARSIFGKTTYGMESGGDPDAIPDLTYDAFLDFHRKYYHPSNAYFYLYGDMDILSCLEHIDTAYLSDFTVSTDLPIITETSVPNAMNWITDTYPAEENEKDPEKGYFAYNIKVGKCTDPKRILAMQLVGYLLLETNASPLKNALRDANICEEAEGYFDSSTYEMVYSIIAKKGKKQNAEKFRQIIETTLANLSVNDFDKELLQGGIKKLEFLLREEDYGSRPKGLIYNTRMMKSWLHGADPFDGLRQIELFEELKQEIKNGYLKQFIKEVLLENQEKTWILFLPEEGKQEKDDTVFTEKIASRVAEMTSDEKQILKDDQKALSDFQNEEDTPEILTQIPLLQREDISSEPEKISFHEKKVNDVTFVQVPLQAKGIDYVQIYFDAKDLPEDLVPYSGLLAEVLSKVDTNKTEFAALPKKIDQIFGGLSFSNDIYSKNQQDYQSFISISFKVLSEDLEKAFDFIKEVIFTSDFSASQSLKKIVQTAKLKGESFFQNQAHLAAIYRSRSAVSAGSAVKEQTSGIVYFHFLMEVEKLLDENPKLVADQLVKTAKMVFTKQHVTAILGCDTTHAETLEKTFLNFVHVLRTEECREAGQNFTAAPRKEAFSIASRVQYNVKTWDLSAMKQKYSGKMQVLKTILTLEYLWTHIRIQGGAYGCGCNFQKNGSIYFYSYRDPNLKDTYEIYDHLWEEIANFQADERQMTKYLIGTINRFDQPKTNAELMDYAAAMYFTGTTHEMRQKERLEILATTADDIRQFSEFLKELSETSNICTIGGKEKIKTDTEIFDNIQILI